MWDTVVNLFANILLTIYKMVGGNFGVAIILFTILIRLVTHPLMVSQIKSSQKMQELQSNKKWQEMQKKLKGDKEKLAQEQMKLYKELGISPFSSCLPTFIQLPIMFALYQSVMISLAPSPIQLLHLTRAVYPIFNLPALLPLNSKFLWMNLGQPERLFIAGVSIPLLAVIVAATTYIQSRVTIPPPSAGGDQTAAMNSMMTIYMPLLMGYFALTFASGLALYIIVGNLLSLGQYAMLGKLHWDNLLPKKKVVRSS